MSTMQYNDLHVKLCEDAYPTDKDGRRRRGRTINAAACAECESPCVWGFDMLKGLDEKAFRELLCGADCRTCRQPCNLRRIALMRDIIWLSRKEKVHKTWLKIAMRPYYERTKELTPP